MGLKNILKIVSLIALPLLTTSCLEKTNNLGTENQETANKVWRWDDLQKQWLYNGTPFVPGVNESPPSMWTKKDQAISLRVESVKSLNAFDNAPKGLQMKVFQLSDPKAFLQAAKSSSGLKHLLVTEEIDPAILAVERLFVLPGVSQSIMLNRLEGTRYIGIILGYASLKQDKIFRLIPVVTLGDEDSSEKSSLLSALGKKAKQPSVKELSLLGHPATLKIHLSLAADGIDKLDVEASK